MKDRNRHALAKQAQVSQGLQQALGRAGFRVFYSRPCLLPCLELEVLLKERSREEASEVDLMLLRCLGLGIRSTASLRRLMGIDVRKLLLDAIGRGLVDGSDGTLRLSETGAETLQLGVPVRKVRRALRLCAISGRLLPRSAYELPFDRILEDKVDTSHGIASFAEPEKVSLAALSSGWQDRKHYLNLPDETVAIEQVISHRPAMLHARLALVGKHSADRGWIAFGRSIEEYTVDQVLPLRGPFDPQRRIKDNGQERTVEVTLIEDLRSKGVEVEGGIQLDAFGLPVISIRRASDAWLNSELMPGLRAALACETRCLPGRAVTDLPRLSKCLDGHALTFRVLDDELCDWLDRYKAAVAAVDAHWVRPAQDRERSLEREVLAQHFDKQEWLLVQTALRRFGARKQQEWCDPEPREDEPQVPSA